ncbi:hypothetical protein F4680DRAFT_459399 [Xylaria scruposa]|nr:hypothetical protein F4680DRAFT_459399 [Xylaria scruposa]
MTHLPENQQLLLNRVGLHATPDHVYQVQIPTTVPRFTPQRTQSALFVGSTRGSRWTWEYVSLALSASAVAALVVLLTFIDQLPLPHWKLPLSPNATVSILAAISRAALGFAISSCLGQAKWNWFMKRPDSLVVFERFDDASRGPWGSFWLIVWLRACHWVAIGAAVMITLLGFEPLFQAILSFDGNIEPSDNYLNAHIGRSEALDVGLYFGDNTAPKIRVQLPQNETLWLEPYRYQPDLGMISAIYSGLYNSSTTKDQTASFTCPTANCTWTPFTTLAICSACKDVTGSLKRYKIEGTNLGTIQGPERYTNWTIQGPERYTNWTIHALPEVNITNMSDVNLFFLKPDEDALPAVMAAKRLTNHQRTISFQNLSSMITTVQILKAIDVDVAQNLKWDDVAVAATECALYFCTKAHRSSIQQGKLDEETIETWFERDSNSYGPLGGPSRYNFTAFDEWNNYSLYTGSGDVPDRTPLRLFIPTEAIEQLHLPSSARDSFGLSYAAVGSTVHFMNDDLFTEKILVYTPFQTNDVQPIVTDILYKSTNLSITFDRLSQSLSNWIRDISPVKQNGKTQEWVVRIKVKWPYIVAPLVEFITGLAFCLFTIFETRRLGLDPWKTDTIATLTHSVDAETRAQLRHAHRHGYLDKTAKAIIVKLQDVGIGLELKTH